MAVPVNKLVRSAVVLGMVGYCAWPVAVDSRSDGKKAPTLPEIAATRLSPSLPPPPQRDPFRPAPSAVVQPEAKDKSPKRVALDKKAGAKDAGAGASRQETARSRIDLLAGLALNATSVRGDERLAVINGHLYTEGETLKSHSASLPPYVVATISPYKVKLAYQDQTAELKYKDAPPRPSAGQQGKGTDQNSKATAAAVKPGPRSTRPVPRDRTNSNRAATARYD